MCSLKKNTKIEPKSSKKQKILGFMVIYKDGTFLGGNCKID